jgi:hypothetical protein
MSVKIAHESEGGGHGTGLNHGGGTALGAAGREDKEDRKQSERSSY